MLNGKDIKIKTYGDFSPIPMGVYTVQINDVNVKNRFNRFKGVDEDALNYCYTILDEGKAEDGSALRGRKLWHAVSPSLNSKSWLFKLARAVVGRDLSQAELESFDPESIIGKQVNCVVEQKASSDGTQMFNNIISYAKTSKQLKNDFEWSEKDLAESRGAKESKSAVESTEDDLDTVPQVDLKGALGIEEEPFPTAKKK